MHVKFEVNSNTDIIVFPLSFSCILSLISQFLALVLPDIRKSLASVEVDSENSDLISMRTG